MTTARNRDKQEAIEAANKLFDGLESVEIKGNAISALKKDYRDGYIAGLLAERERAKGLVEALKYLNCKTIYVGPGLPVRSHTEDCVRCAALTEYERGTK